MNKKSTIIIIGILAALTVLFCVLYDSGLNLKTPLPEGSSDPTAGESEEQTPEKEPDELLFSVR